MTQGFIDYVVGRVRVDFEKSANGDDFLHMLKFDVGIVRVCIARFINVWAVDYMNISGEVARYNFIEDSAILLSAVQANFSEELAKINE